MESIILRQKQNGITKSKVNLLQLVCMLMADLIIYTNKGIMIVEVAFNRDFWDAMLKKLTSFYKDYLVPELLTQKIYKQLSWIYLVHAFT